MFYKTALKPKSHATFNKITDTMSLLHLSNENKDKMVLKFNDFN